MDAQQAFLLGLLGGAIAEFLAVNRHRRDMPSEWPKYFRTWTYWAFGVVWVLLGGVFAWLYNGEPNVSLSQLLAVNIGGTAPLIAEQLFRAVPKLEPGTVG